jgi:hypothetical protein
MKILASYPGRLASVGDLTRDLKILAGSGLDWTHRTKQMASGLPERGIFGAGFVERYSFGWRLTARGLKALEEMENGALTVTNAVPRFEETKQFAGLEENGAAASPPPSSSELAATRRAQFSIIEGTLHQSSETIPSKAA